MYLRSKPKPYSRQPKEVIPLSQRPLLTSPPTDVPRPTSQQVTSLFPDNNGLAKTLMPNNTVSSPPLPFPFGLPPGPTQIESKFKPPPTSVAPDIFSNASELKSPNPISSLPGPMNNHQPPLIQSLTNNSISAQFSDFSSSSFPRAPIHVPLPHSIRESPSLMHYPGYGRSMVNEPRPEMQSPCMYSPSPLRPPLPSSVSPMTMPFERNPVGGYLDRPPNGPTYLPNSSDLYRPFTSIPSATPGYPYSTQSRYSHNAAVYPTASSIPGYSGLGMHPPLHPSAMSGNGPHYGAFQTPSFPSNQSIGCPKNGQCPPASQILDTPLMQERYGSTHNSKDSVSSKNNLKKTKNSEAHCPADELELAEHTRSVFNLTERRRRSSSSSDYWEFLSRKDRQKLPSIPSAPNFCGNMPWDMFNIYSWGRRPASVLSDDTSHASVTSSDFECDIIGIDDLQINAMIRSDGCNSIEIEFDGRASETSGLITKPGNPGSSQNSENETECPTPVKKIYIQGSVHLKQDLGDEGIIQLELPGNKVTIENACLDSELASYSCDLDGLLDFIRKEPDLEYVD